MQDKMEVSEWTKIKSNFSRKKKRKKKLIAPLLPAAHAHLQKVSPVHLWNLKTWHTAGR